MIFYNRIVLGPLSILTWANMAFTLCGHPSKIYIGDPLNYTVGKYFYPLNEIPAYIVAYIYCICIFLIAKTLSYFKNKSKTQ